ncbi:MAG: glycosyltransferase family 1 protein, partial [Thaumarchaeota archaeon]
MELKSGMPKILLVTPRIGGVGGIAQHVRQLAKRLKGIGWGVHLLSSETMRLSMRKGVANIEYALASAAKCLGRSYDIAHGHNLPSILALKFVRAEAKLLTLHG